MSKLTEKLSAQGCDMEATMVRFLNDEEFYEQCFKKVIDDKDFDELKTALDNHDTVKAFECAHTLKGVIANMGLAPMSGVIHRIVEPLRRNEEDGVLKEYEELIKLREEYKTMVEA